MILDRQNLFSDAQPVTATAASTDAIDLGAARDVGPGRPVGLFAQVVEDFDNLTSLTVAVQTADDEAFAAPTTLIEATAPLADLKAGYRFAPLHLPAGVKRYLRLNYVVNGVAPTTGKITAGLSADQDAQRALPAGYVA